MLWDVVLSAFVGVLGAAVALVLLRWPVQWYLGTWDIQKRLDGRLDALERSMLLDPRHAPNVAAVAGRHRRYRDQFRNPDNGGAHE